MWWHEAWLIYSSSVGSSPAIITSRRWRRWWWSCFKFWPRVTPSCVQHVLNNSILFSFNVINVQERGGRRRDGQLRDDSCSILEEETIEFHDLVLASDFAPYFLSPRSNWIAFTPPNYRLMSMARKSSCRPPVRFFSSASKAMIPSITPWTLNCLLASKSFVNFEFTKKGGVSLCAKNVSLQPSESDSFDSAKPNPASHHHHHHRANPNLKSEIPFYTIQDLHPRV